MQGTTFEDDGVVQESAVQDSGPVQNYETHGTTVEDDDGVKESTVYVDERRAPYMRSRFQRKQAVIEDIPGEEVE